jgi:hypothetical protein
LEDEAELERLKSNISRTLQNLELGSES